MVIEQLLYRVVIGYEVLLTVVHCLRRQVFAIVKTEENEERADGNESGQERCLKWEKKIRGQQQMKTSRGEA